MNNQEKDTKSKALYTNEDLKVMQNWSLDRKIATSKAKIIEFYKHFPDRIYV